MAMLSVLLFGSAMLVALWTIVTTVRPKARLIVALVRGGAGMELERREPAPVHRLNPRHQRPTARQAARQVQWSAAA